MPFTDIEGILAEVGKWGGFFRDREDICDNYVIQMHLFR